MCVCPVAVINIYSYMDKMNNNQKRNKKLRLIRLYGCCCWWCGTQLSEKQLTIDHILPKSRGGSNLDENLRLACFKCNNSRGDSLYPPNWRKVI